LSRTLLLDTNILSKLINDDSGRIASKVIAAGADNVCTSIIAAAELRYGALKKKSVRLRREVEELLAEMQVLPFDEPADAEYAKLRLALQEIGKMLAPNDLLIASHASALDATVVTADTAFEYASKLVKVAVWR